MVKRILHVGIATRSIAVTSEFYRNLGLRVDCTEVRREDGVRVAVLSAGDSAIELLEPIDEASPVRRFLDRRGEGIHHIALEVDDLQGEMRKLRAKGVRLVDESPRRGAGGRMIAFVHPESAGGVLVELCDEVEG
jgi:methylmalonyl-CoA epimerase